VVFVIKNLPANTGNIKDADFILGTGRSPGRGHGNPLPSSCLENSMDISCTEEPGELQSMRLQSRTQLKGLSTNTCKDGEENNRIYIFIMNLQHVFPCIKNFEDTGNVFSGPLSRSLSVNLT